MLKLKDLIENFDLAREALSHYDHDADTLENTLQHFRISANAVYPYYCSGRLCFLRMAPISEKSETDLLAELEFLHYLHKNGYPAMRPVSAKDGQELLRLTTAWGEYFACAFEGVPGEPIEENPLTPEIAHVYGASLARLHALSCRFAPACQRPGHSAMLGTVRAHLAGHCAPQAVLTACSALEKELSALDRSAQEYGLVHYDFEPDNVFFDAGTGLCHVIDFDDSIYCWYALDIEQALDSIDPLRHADFLAGYASVRPLPADLARMRALMRRIVDLRSYARLLHCLSEPAIPEPEWMPSLRERLQARMDGLQAKICASIDETASHSV